MIAQTMTNLQYSWSLQLRDVIRTDESTVAWLDATVGNLLNTDRRAVETHTDGIAAWYFIDVPLRHLAAPTADGDVLVLELAHFGGIRLTHVRPAWSGSEPVMDQAHAEAGS